VRVNRPRKALNLSSHLSFTQRVQIHVAKLRENDGILKLTSRRIAGTRRGDDSCDFAPKNAPSRRPQL
jgi:hypothetical protein